MYKYKDIDVMDYLQTAANTFDGYKLDQFDEIKKYISQLAASDDVQEEYILVSITQSGIFGCQEHDAFVKGTLAHLFWLYRGGHNEKILCFAIRITRVKDGIIFGDIYELDSKEHRRRVFRNSVAASKATFVFEKGSVNASVGESPSLIGHSGNLGELKQLIVYPNDPDELKRVLDIEHERYEALPEYEDESSGEELFVETPLGTILVESKGQYNDSPGVRLSLVKDEDTVIPLSMVEYNTAKKKLKTVVYGNSGDSAPMNVTEHNTEAPSVEDEALFLIDDAIYVYIRRINNGYNYTLYNKSDMSALDEGTIISVNMPIQDAVKEIGIFHQLRYKSIKRVPAEKMADILRLS